MIYGRPLTDACTKKEHRLVYFEEVISYMFITSIAIIYIKLKIPKMKNIYRL